VSERSSVAEERHPVSHEREDHEDRAGPERAVVVPEPHPPAAALIVAGLLFGLLARRRGKVIFTEFGLPEGTKWSVTFNGEARDSTTSSIAFDEKRGDHPYSVNQVNGHAPTPASGVVKVSRYPTYVKIAFEGLPP
jgi:hypothetical protein